MLVILTLVLVGCTDHNVENYDCNSFCKDKEYNSGKCFDCVYLDNVNLPIECSSERFIANDDTLNICNKVKSKDNVQHGCLCE